MVNFIGTVGSKSAQCPIIPLLSCHAGPAIYIYCKVSDEAHSTGFPMEITL